MGSVMDSGMGLPRPGLKLDFNRLLSFFPTTLAVGDTAWAYFNGNLNKEKLNDF